MADKFQAYHGVTGAVHQANFNNFSKAGYRMITLNVYGSPGNPRYAAVWVLRSGPAYAATHGINAAAYQTFFNTWTAKGYVPIIVSATGTKSDAIFAAVFEKKNYGTFWANHGLSKAQFIAKNDAAKKSHLILKTCAAYGSSSDRRYAAVWVSNPGNIKWLVYPDLSAAEYQAQFNACIQLPFYSPEIVSVFEDNRYCAMFTDSIRGSFVARHNLTPAAYQKEFDAQVAAKRIPFFVDGGGTGNGTRYAAVFAQSDVPYARTWSKQGSGTVATNGLDNIMKAFMQKHGIRYAQLCLGRNGTVKYNKAFTWAEPTYKPAATSSRFLLASCSKLFLAAAVQAMYDKKLLAPGDAAYAKLGFSKPKDSRSDAITIKQLVDHMGGFDADKFDPTYRMIDVAKDLGLTKPVTKNDIATYMYKKRKLADAPGDKYNYSNYGYVLLSLIIEKITGKDYFAFLKKEVLDKIAVTEVKVWPTEVAKRAADEVATESSGLGLSPLHLSSSLLVPSVYGGDGMIKEVAAASCGIASSALAMVQTINKYAVWGTGGRANGSARSGSTPGSSTLAVSNTLGMDYAYTINTREFVVVGDEKPLDILGADINKYLNDNKGSI